MLGLKPIQTLSFSRRTGKPSQIKMKLLLIAWVVASVFVQGTYLFFLDVDENQSECCRQLLWRAKNTMVSFLPKHSRRGHNCRHFKLLGACIGGKLMNDRPRHLALMTSWVSRSLAFATFASSTMIIRISHAVKAVQIT